MRVRMDTIQLATCGRCDALDIARDVQAIVARSQLRNGIATVFVAGSIAGVTKIEFEPDLVPSFAEAVERIAPRDGKHPQHERGGDNDGHSHIRASLVGPSRTMPLCDGWLPLDAWQQTVVLDFDTRPRSRELSAQLRGE